MKHYPLAGGKRLRPLLSYLVAEAISGDGDVTIPFGVGLELLHNFTLVHDDIMDRSDFRRGITAVHKKFDVPTAIIAGDALFALAFEQLCNLQVDDALLRIIVNDTALAVREVAEGQQMDMEFEKRTDITVKDYLTMVDKKTARLYFTAARTGAIVARAPMDVIRAMGDMGYLMGTGFQIWDDVLDLEGEEDKTGKPFGGDIKEGKRTLMVVYAFSHLKGDERKTFQSILGNQKASKKSIQDAVELLHSCGAVSYAKNFALEYIREAKEKTSGLRSSEAKDLLLDLIDYSVRRDN
ncbi:MAG: polyprenyl synthetase family protein [Candidatus Thermoplasmatota archaeon]|nr:polyprenyl synthetase family protein [Candidatus Thermoplasmatota archaeon]